MEDTLTDLMRDLEAGTRTARGVLEQTLDKIDAQPDLGAYLHLSDRADLLAQADVVDAARKAGDAVGPLAGAPIAIKDNICLQGQPATAGSRILENFISPYDATVVTKLREAGALLLGKTNLDEFAMGSSNETSAFGRVDNPRAPGHVPGGSSGGSAAAVAAGLCHGALGSDTGGSIRQPASHTGIVGLKPTYGRVSRFGLIAFASSLDQIGPMTHSVSDAALLLGTIAGPDPRDATCADVPVPDYLEDLEAGARGLRVGLPREYFDGEGLEPEVAARIDEVRARLEAAGAIIQDVSLPHTEYAVATYYLLATAEASSNLARFDGIRYGRRAQDPKDLTDLYERSRAEGFGAEVKRRIMLGTFVLSAGFYDAYYLKAQKVRTLIARDFARAFDSVDVLLSPTTPSPAFRFGDKSDDPLQMYLEDVYTISCNLAGITGISVPAGTTSAGLPVGAQVLAPAFQESTLLRAARAIEVTP